MKSEEFVNMALAYCGYPSSRYLGPQQGCSIMGFDCSGFVGFLLRQANFKGLIPRHSNELFDQFGIFIHGLARKPGDLIFFCREGGLIPCHVGVMVSEGKYIHSPGRDGEVICVESVSEEDVESNGNGEQLYFNNPIGYKRITVSGEGRYRKPFLV